MIQLQIWPEGKDVYFELRNRSKKVIKYCKLTVQGINPVGDVVTDVQGDTEMILSVVGPLKKNKKKEGMWQSPFRVVNPHLERIHVLEANIDYMDGTSETIPGGEIARIKSHPFVIGASVSVLTLFILIVVIDHLFF